jgi:hypothetical protein
MRYPKSPANALALDIHQDADGAKYAFVLLLKYARAPETRGAVFRPIFSGASATAPQPTRWIAASAG